jgi:hypothetical protein
MSFDRQNHGGREAAPASLGPGSARHFRLSLPDFSRLFGRSLFHRELPPEQTARFRRASAVSKRKEEE